MANFLGLSGMPTGVGPTVTICALIAKACEINPVCLVLGVSMFVTLEVCMRLKKYVAANKKTTKNPRLLTCLKYATDMKELILVSVSIFLAWTTSSVDQEGNTVTMMPTIGVIPPGLPAFQAPWNLPHVHELLLDSEDFHAVHRFVFGSFLVAVTTFLTTYSTAKKQALMHGYELEASREMFALGMAGTVGSFFGSFPPSGSLSRTSLASEVGVRSQLSGLMKFAVVGVSLQYLTPTLFFLPRTTLATIILRSTASLVDLETPKKLWQKWKPRKQGGHRRDFAVWVVAFVLTVERRSVWGWCSCVSF